MGNRYSRAKYFIHLETCGNLTPNHVKGDTDNIGNEDKQNKNTIQKTKQMCNMNPTKNGWEPKCP